MVLFGKLEQSLEADDQADEDDTEAGDYTPL
jgi:hypothetical protein